MDVVDFAREYQRMCDTYERCRECPIVRIYDPCTEAVYKKPQVVVEIVEKWSKEHPVQTNWDKFKEVFGRMGYPDLVRAEPGVTVYASAWWDEPYKAPKEENND